MKQHDTCIMLYSDGNNQHVKTVTWPSNMFQMLHICMSVM
jgi:hypothetical protein